MQEIITAEEKQMIKVNKDKSAFLETITEIDEQKILAETLKRKELMAKEGKKKKNEIKELVNDMLDSPYVKFEDGSEITFAEVYAAKTLNDIMKKPDKTAKDLLDLQKVTKGEDFDNSIKIVFETNGQDLGD